MRKIFFFCMATVLLISVSAMAQNKVVVVPMGSSSAKGTDGQVQYNDNGKTAGAEVYYDKATGKLEELSMEQGIIGYGGREGQEPAY
jgi:hypothetical protein